jgi:uncharacterized UBP type Zn finger protein
VICVINIAQFLLRQQDSHEFLMEFIFAINHQIEKQLKSVLQLDSGARQQSEYVNQVNEAIMHALSPITRHVHAVMEMTLICQNCGQPKESKREVYRDFSLNVRRPDITDDSVGANLEDLFTDYFSEEERTVDCENCLSKGITAKVRPSLQVLPNVLVVHLKRFQYDWRWVQLLTLLMD